MPTKVHLVKAMVFPVVMCGCESWTIKKAECWRIDAFELWYWRRLLRVPWTARRSKQSILKRSVLVVHWKDWCWSWKSSTLATSCEEVTHWKRSWCWEGLWAGGEGDDRGWDGWMASPTQWTWFCVNSGSWWWTGRPGVLQSMGSQRAGHDWATELTDWLNRCSVSSSNCCFLPCIHISEEAGRMVWYSHLLKNFRQFVVMHKVKSLGVVKKADVLIHRHLIYESSVLYFPSWLCHSYYYIIFISKCFNTTINKPVNGFCMYQLFHNCLKCNALWKWMHF